jgi:hypothetical protein
MLLAPAASVQAQLSPSPGYFTASEESSEDCAPYADHVGDLGSKFDCDDCAGKGGKGGKYLGAGGGRYFANAFASVEYLHAAAGDN